MHTLGVIGVRKSVNFDVNKRLDSIDAGIETAFFKVREELDEHRDSINQNTSELTAAYQYIAVLEQKIEKLSERVDELTVHARPELSAYDDFSVTLSIREQEVFLFLYTCDHETSLSNIAKHLGLTADSVAIYVQKLISKGIPLKRYVDGGDERYALDTTFKEIQARKNIVPIDERVLHELGELIV